MAWMARSGEGGSIVLDCCARRLNPQGDPHAAGVGCPASRAEKQEAKLHRRPRLEQVRRAGRRGRKTRASARARADRSGRSPVPSPIPDSTPGSGRRRADSDPDKTGNPPPRRRPRAGARKARQSQPLGIPDAVEDREARQNFGEGPGPEASFRKGADHGAQQLGRGPMEGRAGGGGGKRRGRIAMSARRSKRAGRWEGPLGVCCRIGLGPARAGARNGRPWP